MATGETIRQLRKEKGYTQKQLAEKCDMYESQIRKYELGNANPKLETIRKIAAALDVHISDLVDDWNAFTYKEIADDWEGNKEPYKELTALVEKGRKDIICDLLDSMNDEGQNKAVEQVELLTKIPEYQKEPPGEELREAVEMI